MIIFRGRHRRFLAVSVALVSCLAFRMSAAENGGEAADGEALARHGTTSGLPACSGCHGGAGEGRSDGVPRLAGLPAGYLARQLENFKDRSRTNPVMTPIAGMMDRGAMAAAAAYYAGLTPIRGGTGRSGATTSFAAGETLARRGDWQRGVPACASCHGARGLGVGSAFPPLAGQSAAYIAAQLIAWREGTRHDDPLGLMHVVAARLSDAQVAAAAAYYATLPGAAPARQGAAR